MEDKKFTFLDHLEDLRWCLLKSLAVIVLSCLAAYRFVDQLLTFLIKPVGHIVFTSPAEAFLANMTVTLLAGSFLAMPFILFLFWQFAASALTPHEKRYSLIYLPIAVLLFLGGGFFAYVGILPIALTFFMSFSSPLMIPMITVSSYIGFVGNLILSFGLVFEMPVLIVFLTKIGIATPEFLIAKRRYAILVIFVVSAVLTPPDCVSQVLMAIPLLVLYEISILFSRITIRSKRR